jgi:hypothetical protein
MPGNGGAQLLASISLAERGLWAGAECAQCRRNSAYEAKLNGP